ncbi:DMT family transporter [Paenibacillus mucilaginosus]|uniref:Multidrug resistance protein SMR n=2 Tax=Paenibacillus mucilaginosus TaxID=61624 RepID=I0BG40_9BACL|nr:multidrug efflux SMR transporter [Paenibacillus mucilaginosus]AEI40534.1 YkkD [Paenibacillus mucilaginosus KNP414]AFH61337.1 multidrug resistance protein SMR [Paenibacillus mucilaginosus K02]MCG7216324.1 multidrug efflux SMR transporter [Paenibacillus mucilaginosus]WDM29700.1 multidrug efflux SMR transporter [Paenibacillus mucilaginosus]
MAWISLILAGMFEVVGVLGMNRIKRDNNAQAYLLFSSGIILSFICLSFAMRSLPMGTAYAIWTGIGTVGGALVGMFFFGESKEWRRILFIAMVLAAAVGLKLIS